MMKNETELSRILDRIRKQHDVAPFLQQWHATDRMDLKPMPKDMQAIVLSAPDFVNPAPGSPAVWLQLAAENSSAELVIYRSATDAVLYVLAPRTSE